MKEESDLDNSSLYVLICLCNHVYYKCQDYTCKFLLTIGFKGKVASHSKRNKTVFCVFGENAVQMLLGILWHLCDFMTLRLVILSCSLCPPRVFMSFVDFLQFLHPAIYADRPNELNQPNAFIYSVFIFSLSLVFSAFAFAGLFRKPFSLFMVHCSMRLHPHPHVNDCDYPGFWT